ncbi:hypothetical protein ABNQ39_20685 [Azospirillum sp. A26]|uniref:hypothetical protein n=1 Tax=Azospirillum sp. A26 TaxID=3160607 RepID=UPI00366B5D0E
MTAERLIDAMAEAICNAGRGHVSYWLTAPPEDRVMYRREARAALRALHDHGPTPAMLEAVVKPRVTDPECAASLWRFAVTEDFRAMLVAELEERTDG